MEKNEIEQLARTARHDKTALETLYDYFFPKIFAYVGWRIVSRAETEDVVSDIFMKMVKHIGSYTSTENGSFQAWLYRVAQTTIIDHHRSRRPTVPLDQAVDLAAAPSDLDARLDARLMFNQALEALKKLPDREAEIIRLRFIAELSNQEIALLLGIGEKSVSGAISKALAKLRVGF